MCTTVPMCWSESVLSLLESFRTLLGLSSGLVVRTLTHWAAWPRQWILVENLSISFHDTVQTYQYYHIDQERPSVAVLHFSESCTPPTPYENDRGREVSWETAAGLSAHSRGGGEGVCGVCSGPGATGFSYCPALSLPDTEQWRRGRYPQYLSNNMLERLDRSRAPAREGIQSTCGKWKGSWNDWSKSQAWDIFRN